MPTTRAKLRIIGRVQGVFFRQTTRQRAVALGLAGWVRNCEDGAVELEVWGPSDKVQELIIWCHQGPPSAEVKQVQIEWRQDAEQSSLLDKEFEITD